MAGLDYLYEIKEWPIKGKHLAKVWEKAGVYFLKFAGAEILIQPGRRAHLSLARPLAQTPTGEAMRLRKLFEGRRLIDFGLWNRDRILFFDFGGSKLVFEMFAGGDRLILDAENNIIHSLKGRRGLYNPAPPRTLDEIADDLPIGKALAQTYLGSPYVKYILQHLNIDQRTPIDQLDWPHIKAEIKQILQNLRPYYTEGDFFLLPKEGYQPWKGSFWQLLDRLYMPRPKTKKLERREVAADLRKRAEWIWMHADYVDEIIQRVRRGETPPNVVDINWKNRWFILEVDEDEDS